MRDPGLVAGWVRLAASGVTVPEAYTAPLSAVALLLGLLLRRREPETPSRGVDQAMSFRQSSVINGTERGPAVTGTTRERSRSTTPIPRGEAR